MPRLVTDPPCTTRPIGSLGVPKVTPIVSPATVNVALPTMLNSFEAGT